MSDVNTHPLGREVHIPTRANQPPSPGGNTVDPLEEHNMHPRFGLGESGQY